MYRVPSEVSNNRVSVWRDLKRMGALYLQQCVCVLPLRAEVRIAVNEVRDKIVRLGGSSNLFEVSSLAEDEERALFEGFRDLSARQYAEIVEECEIKFVKEVEFETFRQNFTFAEADEIEQDLDKIRRWYARVQERDWFGTAGREDVARWIGQCELLLEGFYTEVHARTAANANGPEAAEMGSTAHGHLPRLAVVPLGDEVGQGQAPRRRRKARERR